MNETQFPVAPEVLTPEDKLVRRQVRKAAADARRAGQKQRKDFIADFARTVEQGKPFAYLAVREGSLRAVLHNLKDTLSGTFEGGIVTGCWQVIGQQVEAVGVDALRPHLEALHGSLTRVLYPQPEEVQPEAQPENEPS